ncbi:MAG: invasion associated locus B family protein [Brucellaceae bacterium]|nr:invasion associated locus B family protein [Brucellaceae bacterium]
MHKMRQPILRAVATISMALTLGSATAAWSAAGLPGGASSLTETYGNWTVTCLVQKQGENQKVLCSMSQQQVDDKRQRALAVEISPSDKNSAAGAFVLPFGLKLASGATLQLDETPADQPLAFTTCLPAGCIVPVNLDAAKADALGKGKNLFVLAQAMDGNQIKLNVPLDGFAAALKRTRELLK